MKEAEEIIDKPPPVVLKTSSWKNFIAGGVGGICLVLTGHPFDTIKVKLQAMSKRTAVVQPVGVLDYTGALDCCRNTFAKEGFKGFYKGMGTPIVMVTPIVAVGFFGYNMGKKIVSHVSGTKLCADMTPFQLFCSGAISGILTSTIGTPVERIKCLLQVQHEQVKKYKGPLHCGRSLLEEGGIQYLYRGFGATFIRSIPLSGFFYMTYDCLKRYFNARDKTTSLSTAKTLLAGGLTGIINWTLVLPLDVIKSRVQTAPEGMYPRGVRDALPQLLKAEGVKGLFRGIVPVFLRAFPANAACFMGFETAVKVLDWMV